MGTRRQCGSFVTLLVSRACCIQVLAYDSRLSTHTADSSDEHKKVKLSIDVERKNSFYSGMVFGKKGKRDIKVIG